MMQHNFDAEAFLDWIDEHDGAVPREELQEEWPNFPFENIGTVTVTLDDDGRSCYFQRDLRRAAKGQGPRD